MMGYDHHHHDDSPANSDKNRPTTELLKIIRELYYNSHAGGSSSTSNTDERDRIIRKVETQFDECDRRIDSYIHKSSKDLSRLIKVFNEIASKIESSRSQVAASRDALRQCKTLLSSKRDEVYRLWLEWCEQRAYHESMQRVRDVYGATENVRVLYEEQKKFLEAAELVSRCTQLLESEFREVAGLNDAKRQLDDERLRLEKALFQELQDILYTRVTSSVLETGTVATFGRENSSKRRIRHTATAATAASHHQQSTVTSAESTATTADLDQIERLVQAAAKLNNVDTANNINIVEKMINDLNKNITNQLVQMVNVTSNHVVESNQIDTSKRLFRGMRQQQTHQVQSDPKYLCQLIDLTFEQFRASARFYRQFIDAASKVNQSKYHSGLVWSCVQSVLIQLLEEYLDIRQTQSSQTSADALDKMDINVFFARRRLFGFGADPTAAATAATTTTAAALSATQQLQQDSQFSESQQQQQRRSIFTFKASSHAMNIRNYMREQKNENLFKTNGDLDSPMDSDMAMAAAALSSENRIFKVLVCQPNIRNITAIFQTMEHILKEISDETRSINISSAAAAAATSSSEQQQLEKFLQEFILKTFITHAVESIKENAARLSSSSSSAKEDEIKSSGDMTAIQISKELISMTKQRELALAKPILQSTLAVYQSCHDLYGLITDMSSYASEFTRAMHSLIEKHAEYCQSLLVSIVKSNSSGNFVYSMCWINDENINKYFKQLPAFSAAIKGKPTPAAQVLAATQAAEAGSAAASEVLAADVEIEQVNIEPMSKEVETLISNLNDELDEVDIITNFNYIEMVAHLHESVDWLIAQLRQIVSSLEQMVRQPKSLNSSLSFAELSRLNKQLDELDRFRGDTLLLLYLETRVHCFYHLLNFIRQENSTAYAGDLDTDPDESVLSMNRDLHRIYEHLTRSLQDNKVNYVFDALGFMIASIFIRAIKNFKKISTHGIAKMCRNIFHVEQNLSAMRNKSDPHLMKAHRFYELLYKKPEELLNHLEEHAAEFTIYDYQNLLNLIYRSQPGSELNQLADNVQRLQKILKHKH